jgi:hypothetical protein
MAKISQNCACLLISRQLALSHHNGNPVLQSKTKTTQSVLLKTLSFTGPINLYPENHYAGNSLRLKIQT